MKARVLFGVGGFAFVLLALYVFPPIILETLMLPLCALASYEFLGSTKLVQNQKLLFLSILMSVFLAAFYAYQLPNFFAEAAIIVMVMLSMLCLLRHHDTVTIQEVACAAFGSMVIPYMLLALIRIFHFPFGSLLVLMPMLAAWGSDTCALFAGMAFGKHKLAPVISPKKTIEGAVGGVIGGTICVVIFTAIVRHTTTLMLPYPAAIVLGALGAVIGQIGDLSFSIVKRQTNIKDYGTIFPGHGGVLDRFDSVIFVAPLAELIVRYFGA